MHHNTGLNKVFLVGEVVHAPRWHTVQQTKQQLCFIICTKESIKSNKGTTGHLEYHHIKMNEDNHYLVNNEIKKGQVLYIQGKIVTHSFVDSQLIKRYKTEILAITVELFINESNTSNSDEFVYPENLDEIQ